MKTHDVRRPLPCDTCDISRTPLISLVDYADLIIEFVAAALQVIFLIIPAGSPSRGGDVTVYVFNKNQPSLPTPFYFVLVSISVLLPFQLYFIP